MGKGNGFDTPSPAESMLPSILVEERVPRLVRKLHRREREVELEPIDEGVFREVDGGAWAKISAVCPVGDEEALAGKVEGGRPDRGDSKICGLIAEGADPPRGGNGFGVR